MTTSRVPRSRPDPGLPVPLPRRFVPVANDLSDDGAMAPVDLRRMTGILRRRLGPVLIVAAVIAASAAAYAWTRKPVYRSTAVIRLKDSRGAISPGLTGEEEPTLGGQQVNPLLSLVEILSSRTVAGTVVDSTPILRVRAHGIPVGSLSSVLVNGDRQRDTLSMTFTEKGSLFAGAADSGPVPYGVPGGHSGFYVTIARRPAADAAMIELIPRESAVSAVVQHLRVKPRENTDVVDVMYTSEDPALARNVANRLIQLFQVINTQSVQQESRARRVFLEGQLRDADRDLDAARTALAGLQARQRALSARDRFTAEQAEVGGLQGRREELDAQRRLYRTLLDKLQASPAGSSAAITAILSSPGLAENTVIRQIADQLSHYQTQRDSLTSGPYGSAATNPDVARLNALIASTQERLVSAVRSGISVLDARIAPLDAQRTSAASSFTRLSRDAGEEARLLQALDARTRRDEQLRDEYQKARLAEAVQVGQVEIVDQAGPVAPVGQPPIRIAIFGVLLGLIVGALAGLFIDYLRPTIRRQRELADALQSPNPIVIPRFRGRSSLFASTRRHGADTLMMLTDPTGGSAEAFRALRTKLIFSDSSAEMKTLLVTSAVEGEGKTTLAANLAVAYAQQGVRVLLVDADMRRANLHRIFDVNRAPGLSTLLSGAALPAQAIHRTQIENLWILPAGALPANPAEILGAASVPAVLEFLAKEYDVVVIDSPPVLAAADASIVAAMSHGVLLVVRAGRAEREVVRAAYDQLTDVGATLVGAALNDPDGEIVRSGGAYYFYGYAGVHGGDHH
ncbi:MAG: polysaccharide biosynthesis tyrosine autokinase [Bacillota bacterium]